MHDDHARIRWTLPVCQRRVRADLRVLPRRGHRADASLADEEPDLVAWPESSLGIDPATDATVADLISLAAQSVDAPLIIGANFDVDVDSYVVEALLVDESGQVVDRYQKTHLVPFGEYVPARAWLEWIPTLDQVPTDAIRAHEERVFTIDSTMVAPVISFESDFGELVQNRIAAGGRLLVVTTNMSTWGNSWAAAQHEAMSRVRAVENGVPVVHAALSGISALVSPDGGVIERSRLNEPTTLVADVAPADGVTIYARTGDWFAYLCATMSFIGLVLARRKKDTVTP